MDPRSAPQNTFVQQRSSENIISDSRKAPVPPLPYTLQTPVRPSQPTLSNDPFFPRRNERDDPRQGPLNRPSQSPFSLDKYAASLARDVPHPVSLGPEGHHVLRESRGTWRLGDGRADGYRPRDTQGGFHLSYGSTNLLSTSDCGIVSYFSAVLRVSNVLHLPSVSISTCEFGLPFIHFNLSQQRSRMSFGSLIST